MVVARSGRVEIVETRLLSCSLFGVVSSLKSEVVVVELWSCIGCPRVGIGGLCLSVGVGEFEVASWER